MPKFVFFSIIVAGLILLFGGFTYIRNFIQSGSPLFPVDFDLFGFKFKGPMAFSILRDTISLWNVDLEEMLFHQSFGLHFVILAFPALFLSLPILLWKTRFRIAFDILYLLLLPLLMIAVFYAKCPHHTPSYLYHIVALGTLIGVYALDKLNIPQKVLKGIIFILIVAATAELAGHMMLFISLALSGIIFVVLTFAKNESRWIFYKIVSVVLLLVFLVVLLPLENYYENTKYQNYNRTFRWEKDLIKAWQCVYRETLNTPKNIAHAGSGPVFPLYGKKFKNNAYYVSVNDKEPYLTNFSRYYHLHDSFEEWLQLLRLDGCLREKANFSTWLKNLRKRNTDLLFIMCTDDFKVFPIEDEWARKHPSIFKPVFTNERVHIYEL